MALGLGLGLLAASQAQGSVLYPKDLAVLLVSEQDVRSETAAGFQRVEEVAIPSLLGPPVVPLGDVPVAEGRADRVLPRPTQWEVPPFPSLEPALPRDLPPEVLAQITRDPAGPTAPVFGELQPFRYQVSAELRPRAVRPSDLLRPRGGEAPTPFSLRRYSTEKEGFVQVAVYGGTTSIKAEQIYQTLRAAALDREDIQGVGREGFLTRIPVPQNEAPSAPLSPAPEQTPAAEPASQLGGFDAIKPTGPARPDLLVPGLAESASAPSFRGVPTRLEEKPSPPRPAAETRDDAADELRAISDEEAAAAPVTPLARKPIEGPSMLVLVAFFPDRAAVLEVAVDERIANMQQLLNLALKAQTRLGEVWSEQTQR